MAEPVNGNTPQKKTLLHGVIYVHAAEYLMSIYLTGKGFAKRTDNRETKAYKSCIAYMYFIYMYFIYMHIYIHH